MRLRIVAIAVVILVLTIANWSKITASHSEPATGLVRVVNGASRANIDPTATKPEAIESYHASASKMRQQEYKLQETTFKILTARRERSSVKNPSDTLGRRNIPQEVMSFDEFKSMTSFNCSETGCLITASPGQGKRTSKELVATLVAIEAGLNNKELSAIGYHPGTIKARIVNGIPLVNLALNPNT